MEMAWWQPAVVLSLLWKSCRWEKKKDLITRMLVYLCKFRKSSGNRNENQREAFSGELVCHWKQPQTFSHNQRRVGLWMSCTQTHSHQLGLQFWWFGWWVLWSSPVPTGGTSSVSIGHHLKVTMASVMKEQVQQPEFMEWERRENTTRDKANTKTPAAPAGLKTKDYFGGYCSIKFITTGGFLCPFVQQKLRRSCWY